MYEYNTVKPFGKIIHGNTKESFLYKEGMSKQTLFDMTDLSG
jgi:hypothetical protein